MVIDPKVGLGGLASQQSQKTAPRAAPEGAGTSRTDKPAHAESVQLSEQAHSLKRLEDNIAKAPIVNEDRVAALKAAVADGSYRVDADRLADKILSSEGF